VLIWGSAWDQRSIHFELRERWSPAGVPASEGTTVGIAHSRSWNDSLYDL